MHWRIKHEGQDYGRKYFRVFVRCDEDSRWRDIGTLYLTNDEFCDLRDRSEQAGVEFIDETPRGAVPDGS